MPQDRDQTRKIMYPIRVPCAINIELACVASFVLLVVI
jgi:hypothetical protein